MFLRRELAATVLENYFLKEDESKIALPGALEDEANVSKAWLMSGFFDKFSAVVYDLLVSLSSVEYNQIIKCNIIKQAIHLFTIFT